MRQGFPVSPVGMSTEDSEEIEINETGSLGGYYSEASICSSSPRKKECVRVFPRRVDLGGCILKRVLLHTDSMVSHISPHSPLAYQILFPFNLLRQKVFCLCDTAT